LRNRDRRVNTKRRAAVNPRAISLSFEKTTGRLTAARVAIADAAGHGITWFPARWSNLLRFNGFSDDVHRYAAEFQLKPGLERCQISLRRPHGPIATTDPWNDHIKRRLSRRGGPKMPLPSVNTSYILWIYFRRPAMQKTLTRHGNSYALVIDKPILELLRVTPETPFEILTDGNVLLLTPIRDPKEEKKFKEALRTTHQRIGRALKKLAE
jgi:antitoxin component of MazEF toxin-antitoxin module